MECRPEVIEREDVNRRASSTGKSEAASEVRKVEGRKRRANKVAKRGEITGFSKASRRRMFRMMGTMNRTHLEGALFAHLTYPAKELKPSSKQAKAHLKALIKRIRYRWSKAFIVWKMEPTKAGVIHFHLVIVGVHWIAAKWLGRAWYEVVGTGLAKHEQAGTRIERVQSYRHAIAYLQKYIGKVEAFAFGEEVGGPGRFWGVCGERSEYDATPLDVELSRKDFCELVRTMEGLRRTWARKKGRKVKKRGWYCSKASFYLTETAAIVRFLSWKSKTDGGEE